MNAASDLCSTSATLPLSAVLPSNPDLWIYKFHVAAEADGLRRANKGEFDAWLLIEVVQWRSEVTLFVLSAILSVKSSSIGKACAVGCSNRFIKGWAFIFIVSLKMKDVNPSG